jgi:hypothetical protein
VKPRVALASSLDFLQGTFEKIGFQRLPATRRFNLRDLESEFALLAVLRGSSHLYCNR